MSGPAQSVSPAALESAVRAAADGFGDAGFGVAVSVGGRVEQLSLGSANPELGLAMTDDTLVQVGATMKLLNAALVMRLVEQGELDLDRPVVEVLSDFRLADAEATAVLTLRHCLSMTSGMGGGPFPGDFGSDPDCLARYVAALAEIPHLFPPGAGFGYSNAGCVIAARAAEVVTGERWDDLLRARILDPAGMAHTETLAERLMFHRVAVGVGPDGGVMRPYYLTRSIGPGGTTGASTAGDLVRLGGLFLSGGRANGTQVLSAETVAAMTQPVVAVATGFSAEHWCLGPGWTDTGSHVILSHHGGNASGTSLLWWVPALDAAVACVTNAPAAYGALVSCAGAIVSELGCSPPAAPQPAPHSAPAGDVAGVYENAFMRFEVTESDGDVALRAQGLGVLAGLDVRTRLIPAGRHGFLPERPLRPGFGAPVAIAFADYAGVRVLLNGNGPARRVSPTPTTKAS